MKIYHTNSKRKKGPIQDHLRTSPKLTYMQCQYQFKNLGKLQDNFETNSPTTLILCQNKFKTKSRPL